MVGLLHYLYSLQADFYTSENLINIDGPKFLKIIVRVRKYHTVYLENKLFIWKLDFEEFCSEDINGL